MGRINTNVQSLIAQNVLAHNQANLATSLQRLSTGLRINSGKDDPAGLVVANNLGAQIAGQNAAISNANRADQIVNIASGGLTQVTGLLTQLQGLVTQSASSAGISDTERQSNQAQVDSILQTIDRIANSTSFQGVQLLNGNLGFRTSNVNAGVAAFQINAAKFSGAYQNVNVLVTGSAQKGGAFLSFGANAITTTTGSQFTIEVGGVSGTRQLTFSSGTTLANIANAINSFTSLTGTAATVSGTGIRLSATSFGSANFASIKVINAAGVTSSGQQGVYALNTTNANAASTTRLSTFANLTNTLSESGKDLGATINGVAATTNGKTASINTDFLSLQLTLSDSQSQTIGSVGANALTITGGGATFNVGANVNIGGKVSIGIGSVATSSLGSSVDGYLSSLASGQANNLSGGNVNQAQQIITDAISQVSALAGRLGAFQANTVEATVQNLNVAVENTTAAQSTIQDTNFASETANLTRNQILVSAATSIMGVANSSPQSVLQLLQG